MKKTTKKISAAALALIMGATAFTGCSGSANSTPGGTDSAASTSGGAATGSQKIMSSNENVKSAVDNVSVAEDYKNIKVDTKLKFMAWYDIQEASPAVELFKTLYGTPKNKPEGYESVADENVFVNVKVSNYNNRYLDLAKLVQSDESPDTFPFETSNYPYGIYQNLFQTIDGVVDTNTEDWVDYKPIIDKFNWGGKVYTPIVDVNPQLCSGTESPSLKKTALMILGSCLKRASGHGQSASKWQESSQIPTTQSMRLTVTALITHLSLHQVSPLSVLRAVSW